MAAHFAGDMGKDLMLVIQHNPEHCAWQNRLNRPFQLNGLFTTHIYAATGFPHTRGSENFLHPCPGFGRNVVFGNVDFIRLGRKKLLRASKLFFELPEVHFDQRWPAVRAGIRHRTTPQIID